ncbi:hypothetical protein GCM10007276_13370 [Agaricicola taiwanensis]|uniref:Uncharacterized protein n=1 Tax=Agaricicola taiwanensis TaxID=591372 RepID=A0A8J2VW60_9RHOB|nr:hypothetical protein [Agaricicola taiwanensis]GGE37253.1 hypothetical protein GCM10007276_13370 [Agaricicola taiwanensis]
MSGPPLFALLIVLVGGAALVIADVFGFADVTDGRIASLVALLAIAVWVGSGFLGRYSGRGSEALRHLAIWLAIATLITAIYVWQAPIKDMLGIS